MSIRVRYFASLREAFDCAEEELSSDQIHSVQDAWNQAIHKHTLHARLPDHILYAVNMTYAEKDTPVADGDEVAFFPPVTGG